MKTLSLFVLCVWTLNASASSWQVLGDTHNSNNLKEATKLLDSLATPKTPPEPLSGLAQPQNSPPKEFFQDDDNILVYYMKDTPVKEEVPNLIDQEEDQVYTLNFEEEEGDEIGEEILFEEDENQDTPPVFKNKDIIDFEDLYASTVFTDPSPVPDSPWPVDLSLKDETYSIKGENEINLSQAVSLTPPEETPMDSEPIPSPYPYEEISIPQSDGPTVQYDSAGHPMTEHENEIESFLESAAISNPEHYEEEGGEEEDEEEEDDDDDTPYANDAFPPLYDIPEPTPIHKTYEQKPHTYKLYGYNIWVWGTCFISVLCIFVYRETKQNQGVTEHWRHKSDKEEEKLPLHVKDLSHQTVPFSGVMVDQAKSGSIDMPTNKGRRASLGHTHIIKHQQRAGSSHVRHMSLGSNSLMGRDHKQALWNEWKVVEEEDGENGW
ncbi:hypothetical protein CLU79DRAFT_765866 [Phycomyces nitens]|nr:hypothetical protein CLU79DRAFT_765866 [Phycomyces nitens]